MVPAGVYKMAMAIIFFLTVQETFTLGGAQLALVASKKDCHFIHPCRHHFCPNYLKFHVCIVLYQVPLQIKFQVIRTIRFWDMELASLPKKMHIWSVLPKGLGVQLLTFSELCLHGTQLAPTGLYTQLHLTPPCRKINKHLYSRSWPNTLVSRCWSKALVTRLIALSPAAH